MRPVVEYQREGPSDALRLARWFVCLWLFLAIGACAAMATRGSTAPNGDGTLRVMTFNIHHGADAQDRMNLERIAGVIREQNPDIVLLQEVDRGVERSGGRDLLGELADLTGIPHSAFGKNIDHEGGDYGTALLSRHPIVRSENTHLRQGKPERERRGVLQAVVEVQGTEVAVLGTHLDAGDSEERRISVAEIVEEMLPRFATMPILLGGDLNEDPTGEVHRLLSTRLDDAWSVEFGEGATVPVDAPRHRIDYIFHSPEFVVDTAYVVVTDASDHRPVMAVLRLR